MRRLLHLFRNLFQRSSVEQDLDREMRSFLDLLTDEKIQAGMTPDQARRAALIELGGLEQVKEQSRDIRIGAFLDIFWRDFLYGFRLTSKRLGEFAIATLTLALGIGTATTLFSVVESQLWRPLPFRQPECLVSVWEHNLKRAWRWGAVSAPTFADWRQRTGSLERLGAIRWSTPRNFNAHGLTERPWVGTISAGFLETLEVQLKLGHTFEPANEQPGQGREAILSSSLARRAFTEPWNALDQTIRLNGENYTVIGVLPDDFRLEIMRTPDVFVPLELNSHQRRDDRDLEVVGRMNPGVTRKQVEAEFQSLARQIESEHPDTNSHWGTYVEDLLTSSTWFARTSLLLYLGFALFVLVIACANVAGLQIVRFTSRKREFAVREALGASRGTLIRQSIIESSWIAVVGAALGVGLAVAGIQAIQTLPLSDMFPRGNVLSLDARAVVFAVLVSIVSTILFGLIPGLSASQIHVEAALRDSERAVSGSVRTRYRIDVLVTAEVALAFISVFGAGLFVSSQWELQRIPLGFIPGDLLTIRIPLSGTKYKDPSQAVAFYQRVIQKSEAAGVREIALANGLPLAGADDINFVRTDKPRSPRGEEANSLARAVTPEYFRLLSIPLLRGRGFTRFDSEGSSRVAIVNENLARHFFAGESPVGKELLLFSSGDSGIPEGKVEIIGVAANVKEVGLDEVDFDDIYLPLAQNPSRDLFLVAKTRDPNRVGSELRREFQDLDKDEFVAVPRTFESYVDDAFRGTRVKLTLIVIFASLSLLLTAIGIYGAISFTLSQRTREFGLRVALGARPENVARLALSHTLRLVLVGSVCGLVIAFVLGEVFRRALYLAPHEHEGVLYKVGIHDPLSLGCAASLVFLWGALASLSPILRATQTDPNEVLRHQ